MNKLSLSALALGSALALSACETTPPPNPMVAAFDVTAFAWSTMAGANEIEGQVSYVGGGRPWTCAGSVGLTPETAWTRQRFQTLYGSAERAALPAAVIRARTVVEATADYRTFMRNTTCDANGRFSFEGLPDGAWFVIAPVTAEGSDPLVLMRRVETRGGRVTVVSLD